MNDDVQSPAPVIAVSLDENVPVVPLPEIEGALVHAREQVVLHLERAKGPKRGRRLRTYREAPSASFSVSEAWMPHRAACVSPSCEARLSSFLPVDQNPRSVLPDH